MFSDRYKKPENQGLFEEMKRFYEKCNNEYREACARGEKEPETYMISAGSDFYYLFSDRCFFVLQKTGGCIYRVSFRPWTPVFHKIAAVKGFEHMTADQIESWEKLTKGRYIKGRPSFASFYGKSVDEINGMMFDDETADKYAAALDEQEMVIAYDSRKKDIIIPKSYYTDGIAVGGNEIEYTDIKAFETTLKELAGFGFSSVSFGRGTTSYVVLQNMKETIKRCDFVVKFLGAPQSFPSLFGTLSLQFIKSNRAQSYEACCEHGKTIVFTEYCRTAFFHEWMHAFDAFYEKISPSGCGLSENPRYWKGTDERSLKLRALLIGTKDSPSQMEKDAKALDRYRSEEHGYKTPHCLYARDEEVYARAFSCYMEDSAALYNKDKRYGRFTPEGFDYENPFELYPAGYLEWLDDICEDIGDDKKKRSEISMRDGTCAYSREACRISCVQGVF